MVVISDRARLRTWWIVRGEESRESVTGWGVKMDEVVAFDVVEEARGVCSFADEQEVSTDEVVKSRRVQMSGWRR